MPEIGEIKKGQYIGKYKYINYIYHACEDCGKERWVTYKNGQVNLKQYTCRSCGTLKGKGGKGGRRLSGSYIQVLLKPNEFFYPMLGKCQYIMEHRLVMAKHLGRCLQPWEKVHHKNGIKTDNRIENLELTDNGAHITAHSKGYRDGFIKGYSDGKDKRIRELKEENRVIKAELKGVSAKHA